MLRSPNGSLCPDPQPKVPSLNRATSKPLFTFQAQANCPICQGSARKRVGHRGNKTILESLKNYPEFKTTIFTCSSCGHFYPDPLPVRESSLLPEEPVESYFLDAESIRLELYRDFMNQVEGRCEKGRLLDVGCGAGSLLQAALERGWEVSGIEPNPEFVAVARARGLGIHQGTLDDNFHTDRPFDVVTAIAVLEHVVDPVAILRGARRVSRQGSFLFVEVPNGRRLEATLIDAFLRMRRGSWTVRTCPMHHPFHLAEFSQASISRALETAGFDLLELRTVAGRTPYPLPPLSRAVLRTLDRLGQPFGWALNMKVVARAR